MIDIDILKRVGQALIEPSGAISFLLLIGVLLLLWKSQRRKSAYVFATALTLYFVFGTGPVAFRLLGSLEFRYPPFEESAANKDVEDIVLLAGYAERNDEVPLTSYVNGTSAIRILEAARIFRMNPTRRITISGKEEVPAIMKDVLVLLGIPNERIVIEKRSSSTKKSAENLSSLLKGKEIILVTSAGHMHRSILNFVKFGIHPIPAPTDFLTRRNYLATGYLPSPLYLNLSNRALHEYAGIFWHSLKLEP